MKFFVTGGSWPRGPQNFGATGVIWHINKKGIDLSSKEIFRFCNLDNLTAYSIELKIAPKMPHNSKKLGV